MCRRGGGGLGLATGESCCVVGLRSSRLRVAVLKDRVSGVEAPLLSEAPVGLRLEEVLKCADVGLNLCFAELR